MGKQARLKRTIRRIIEQKEVKDSLRDLTRGNGRQGNNGQNLQRQGNPSVTAVVPQNTSTPQQPEPWQWAEQQEGKLAALEEHDNFSTLRNRLRLMSAKVDEWAGIPIPIEGERLIIEKTYPFASVLQTPEEKDPDNRKVRNSFFSNKYKVVVVVFETKEGKITWGWLPAANHLGMDLRTMGCSVAWGIEQESKALRLLATMLPHHQFKNYLLTGMFLESSKRSGVRYLFRKLRPTVAIVADKEKDSTRILCCLCLHPIGYYEGTWSGAMAPTDDVIAHLSLVRSDEHFFWRKANQIPAYRPEAGL